MTETIIKADPGYRVLLHNAELWPVIAWRVQGNQVTPITTNNEVNFRLGSGEYFALRTNPCGWVMPDGARANTQAEALKVFPDAM